MRQNIDCVKLSIQESITTFRTFITIIMVIISSLMAFITKNYNHTDIIIKLFVICGIVGIIISTTILIILVKKLFLYINKLKGTTNIC